MIKYIILILCILIFLYLYFKSTKKITPVSIYNKIQTSINTKIINDKINNILKKDKHQYDSCVDIYNKIIENPKSVSLSVAFSILDSNKTTLVNDIYHINIITKNTNIDASNATTTIKNYVDVLNGYINNLKLKQV